jgi:hypothetical protein
MANPETQREFLKVIKVGSGLFAGGLALAFAIAALASPASIGSPAPPNLILFPVFGMFLLVAAVLTWMGVARIGSIFAGSMDIGFYRTYDQGEEPERLRVITRHFINLFEIPVLLYVGVVFAHISQEVTYFLVGLAWAYVALRYVHAWVHLGTNDVAVRLAAYMGSGLVLLVMWVTLLVRLLT